MQYKYCFQLFHIHRNNLLATFLSLHAFILPFLPSNLPLSERLPTSILLHPLQLYIHTRILTTFPFHSSTLILPSFILPFFHHPQSQIPVCIHFLLILTLFLHSCFPISTYSIFNILPFSFTQKIEASVVSVWQAKDIEQAYPFIHLS